MVQLIMEPKNKVISARIVDEINDKHRYSKQSFLSDFHKFYAVESLLKSYAKYGDYPVISISSKVVLSALLTGVSQFNTLTVQTCYESSYVECIDYVEINMDIIEDFEKMINSDLTVFEILCIFYMIWVRMVNYNINLTKDGT